MMPDQPPEHANTMDTISQLRETLHTEIPLTRAIGIDVVDYSGECLTLTAPLQPNTNHKDTAFGGSLYSVAVLAGWGLIHLKLKQLAVPAHIVIQHSKVDYICPVTDDISAVCCFESQPQIDRFLRTYESKGRARIELNAIIRQGEMDAVLFHGRYVIHR